MKYKDKNVELPLYPEQKPPNKLFLMVIASQINNFYLGVIIVGMGLVVWRYLL